MTRQVQKQESIDQNRRGGGKIYSGTFIAEVMDNKDIMQKAGRLWVFIPEFGGIKTEPSTWVCVSYASPFYGISPHLAPSAGASLGSFSDQQAVQDRQQQQSPPVTTYGFWAIPPDIGVRVLCTFVDGETSQGFWFAVVPTVSHGMIPANGAPDGKTPMMDFNPLLPEVLSTTDLSTIQRQPYEPLIQQLTTQGLQEDPIRGPITSSSMRESPSKVFGISSQSTPEAPGHSFVMDDGGEDGTNKLIRLRTSSGNQITMSDDTGMIYLINAGGTGWIELSPSGQIDVYGAAGINMATNGDVNFHADNNVNIHAGNCVKIVGVKGTKVMGGEELQLHGAKTMIEGVDSLHVHSCKEMMFTSFGDIHMKAFNYFCLKGKCFYWNSCTAKEAEQVPPEQPGDVSGYQTTVARAPSKEPYKEHDGGQGAGGGADGNVAPDGSASGTGPGGMFGGENNAGTTPTMDTATTSVGSDFSLGFRTGLAGNRIGTGANNWGTGSGQTQPRDAGRGTLPATSASGSSMGMSFTGIQTNAPSVTQPAASFTPPSAARTTFMQGAVKTTSGSVVSSTYKPATSVNNSAITADAALSGSFTTNYGVNKPSTITVNTTTPTNAAVTADAALSGSFTTNYATAPSTTATTIPVSSPAANPYLGRGGAQPVGADPALANVPDPNSMPAGVFDSPNPADQSATGRSTPAQEASGALDQTFGQSPSSDLPAAPGGGGTGCFAQGDNCERPADGTGGGGGPGGGAPDNLDTTLGQSPEDLQKTYDQLRDQGLTHEQAIGAMANIQRESGFRPGAIGDNGNSFGIYQFNEPAGRAQGLFNDVPDWQTNAAGQHRYMFTKDSLGRAYAGRSYSSSLQAANDFTNRVEIPRNRASYTAPGGFNSRIVPKLEASITRRP